MSVGTLLLLLLLYLCAACAEEARLLLERDVALGSLLAAAAAAEASSAGTAAAPALWRGAAPPAPLALASSQLLPGRLRSNNSPEADAAGSPPVAAVLVLSAVCIPQHLFDDVAVADPPRSALALSQLSAGPSTSSDSAANSVLQAHDSSLNSCVWWR